MRAAIPVPTAASARSSAPASGASASGFHWCNASLCACMHCPVISGKNRMSHTGLPFPNKSPVSHLNFPQVGLEW